MVPTFGSEPVAGDWYLPWVFVATLTFASNVGFPAAAALFFALMRHFKSVGVHPATHAGTGTISIGDGGSEPTIRLVRVLPLKLGELASDVGLGNAPTMLSGSVGVVSRV